MKRTLAALAGGPALLVLLVGCGSDDSDSESGQRSVEATVDFPRAGTQVYSTPQELVDDLAAGGIACTEFRVNKPTPLDSEGEQSAMCRFPVAASEGSFFVASTYPTVAAMQADASPSLDGGLQVEGGNWRVDCLSVQAGNACIEIQGVLGGTIVR